jgi:hypothetical protein
VCAAAGEPSDADELQALGQLLHGSHRLAPSDLPVAVADAATALGASRAVIYVVDFEQRVMAPLDADEAVLDIDGTVAGRAFRLHEAVETTGKSGVQLWAPLLDGADRHGMLALHFDHEPDGELRSRCERFASLVALLVVSKTALGDDLERPRRRKEMRLAAELRWAALPPLSFVNDLVEVAGVLEPAYEVAGDSFDYAINGNIAHVAVFDAMGHGLEASRIANLAVVSYRNSRRHGLDLVDTLRAIDSQIAEQFGPERFVTGQLAQLDVDTGHLRFLSAGHPRPLLLRQDRVVGELPADSTFPLGFGDLTATVAEFDLQPGDRIVFYTDGVIEARSASGEEFGLARLGDFVARAAAAHEPPAETVRRLVHSVLAHEAGQLRDDATVLMLGWPRGA